MPCKDITEILQIKINDKNQIFDYSLIKKTCGGNVGSDKPILGWLQKFSADDILKTTPAEFMNDHQFEDEIAEYIHLKNYLAVKNGIAIMLGKESGSKTDFCTVDSIKYGPKAMIFTGFIKIDALTEEIKACGNCSNNEN